MREYEPDRWMVLRITTARTKIYKVFATWVGGYTGSDAWKMNSGITGATMTDGRWEFAGHSGSIYSCHEHSYGVTGYGSHVLANFQEEAKGVDAEITVMPEATDWATLDYDRLQQFVQEGAKDA